MFLASSGSENKKTVFFQTPLFEKKNGPFPRHGFSRKPKKK
jgi:hypothetical protein